MAGEVIRLPFFIAAVCELETQSCALLARCQLVWSLNLTNCGIDEVVEFW